MNTEFESVKPIEQLAKEHEVNALKARAFDLLVNRDKINKQIEAELSDIYTRLNEMVDKE